MRDDMDLGYFENLLKKRREDLLALRDGRMEAAGTVELDQARVGRLSRMDALQQQAMIRATNLRAEAELRQIEAALARIRCGEYGHCLKCGEGIAVKRLEANPGVVTCISCAEGAEKA